MSEKLDSVKFSKVLGLVKTLEKSGMRKDSEVSFEFIVGSLFPNVLSNVQTAIRTQYTKGYTEGIADSKEKINKKFN